MGRWLRLSGRIATTLLISTFVCVGSIESADEFKGGNGGEESSGGELRDMSDGADRWQSESFGAALSDAHSRQNAILKLRNG
jgi:hypothetical protein